jgi:hypothetical protein
MQTHEAQHMANLRCCSVLDSRAKGGLARAEALSPEKRSEIAAKAAKARWEMVDVAQAIRDGEIKIAGLEIPCAVLGDGTRLLTQWGFYRAIGRSGRPAKGWGSDFEKMAPFLDLDNLKPFVSDDLALSSKSPPCATVQTDPLPSRGCRGQGRGDRVKICEEESAMTIKEASAGDRFPCDVLEKP